MTLEEAKQILEPSYWAYGRMTPSQVRLAEGDWELRELEALCVLIRSLTPKP